MKRGEGHGLFLYSSFPPPLGLGAGQKDRGIITILPLFLIMDSLNPMPLWSRYYYYPYFTDEKPEHKEVK